MTKKYILESKEGCYEIKSIGLSLESEFEHLNAFIWKFTYLTGW